MAKAYTLPYFGKLDLDDLDDYYDAQIDFNGNTVELDLHFDGEVPEREKLDTIRSFIEKLQEQDTRNKAYIRADYEDPAADSVKLYLSFHLEQTGEEKLLSHLHLVRVGFYPDAEDYFAVCDYSFGRDVTNYIVVLGLNKRGELLHVTVES